MNGFFVATSSLSDTIATQLARVRQADERLLGTLALAQARVRQRKGTGSSPLWRFASLAGAWLMVRMRRRSTAVAPRRAPSRVAAMLDVALPALAPLIGVRAAALLSALAAASAAGGARAPSTMARVDLNLYAGTWFEIARLPERHERACATDVSATYTRHGKGVRVLNRCRRADGRVREVIGRARVVDRRSRSKLEVTFAPKLLRWLPWVWADYWILDVSPGYRFAVVGTPDRRHLWLLARDPAISAAEYRAMLLVAADRGYDTERVQRSTPRSVH